MTVAILIETVSGVRLANRHRMAGNQFQRGCCELRNEAFRGDATDA
jgi:hypothetical protein